MVERAPLALMRRLNGTAGEPIAEIQRLIEAGPIRRHTRRRADNRDVCGGHKHMRDSPTDKFVIGFPIGYSDVKLASAAPPVSPRPLFALMR